MPFGFLIVPPLKSPILGGKIGFFGPLFQRARLIWALEYREKKGVRKVQNYFPPKQALVIYYRRWILVPVLCLGITMMTLLDKLLDWRRS